MFREPKGMGTHLHLEPDFGGWRNIPDEGFTACETPALEDGVLQTASKTNAVRLTDIPKG